MLQTDKLKAAGIEEQDIRQLEAAWEAYQAAKNQTQRQTPHIVCTGIYNAGKSTLLNALAGEDLFPTGDVPTTKKVAQAGFGGAIYIDTPGLNAAEEDDRETRTAYETADFILFVSNARNGGISEVEAAWLQGLRDRYTEDSLKLRLIYVLTQCGQVDPEQFPAVVERFRADLMKTVGFETVISVDSVTYQKGMAECKPLLTERSGIHDLQRHIADRIKESDSLLAQAQETELSQRRQEVLEQIEKIHAMVQSEKDVAGRKSQEQVVAVEKAWAAFEGELEQTLSKAQRFHEFYAPFFSLNVTSEWGDRKRSESDAKSDARERLSRYYDRISSEVDSVVGKMMREFREYFSTSLNSAYFKKCSAVNQVFEKLTLALQNLGYMISPVGEISVEPDLPSGFEAALQSDLVSGTIPSKSVRSYIDENFNCCPDTDIGKNIFGGMKITTYYKSSIFSAGCAMESDVTKRLKDNVKQANRRLGGVWQGFLKKLETEAARRKAVVKKEVDAYKAALSQSAAPTNLQAALAHLDALKQEVA